MLNYQRVTHDFQIEKPISKPMFGCPLVFYGESNPIYGGLFEFGGLDTMAHGRLSNGSPRYMPKKTTKHAPPKQYVYIYIGLICP